MKKVSRLLPSILSALFLIGVHQAPVSAAEAGRAEDSAAAQAVCHPCNGYRYQVPGSLAVYLVIDGLRHHVPDPATYSNLWSTWDGILPGGSNISIGEPLLSGSFLALERETQRTYLVGRSKRWIPNPTIFRQYAFDWGKVTEAYERNLPGQGPNIPGR